MALNPLDLNANYESRFDFDPESFIECTPGGTPQVIYSNSACVILPDGTMHWQRPATLEWPSINERAEILHLQKSLTPTTPDELPDRIITVQRWQDVLMLEGMDFFPNARCENSFDKVDPWVQRRLCNEALRKGDTATACRELDVLIGYFRTLTAWWYADHTLGDADEDNWIGFTHLKSVSDQGNQIVLKYEYGLNTCDAVLIPQNRGFRFYTREKGDFDSEAVSYTFSEIEGEYQIKTAHSVIVITAGDDWKICADEKFVLDADNFKLYDYAGSKGFDVCQPLLEREMVYGFGERFDAVNQRGRVLSLWHRDAFEGCNCSIGNQSYKNVSFLHSTKGYSLFINSFYRIRADIGRVSKGLRITTAGPKADIYVFTGSVLENMEEYTALTGKPLLPPAWVFEPWAGGGVGRWMDGPTHDVIQEMEGVVRKFKNLDIPHSGLYAEGAGWKWEDHYNKEEIYKIAAFTKQQKMRVFRGSFHIWIWSRQRNFCRTVRKKICQLQERRVIVEKKFFHVLLIFHIQEQRNFWKINGMIEWMQVLMELWWILEKLFQMKQCFTMVVREMKCTTLTRWIIQKRIENSLKNIKEKITCCFQDLRQRVFKSIPASLVETSFQALEA